MDLRAYYRNIRETERSLPSPQVVIVSLSTPDGGKAGIVTETPTAIAARMIIDGIARQASDDERERFQKQNEAAKQAADEAAAISKLQVVVLPSGSVRTIASDREEN